MRILSLMLSVWWHFSHLAFMGWITSSTFKCTLKYFEKWEEKLFSIKILKLRALWVIILSFSCLLIHPTHKSPSTANFWCLLSASKHTEGMWMASVIILQHHHKQVDNKGLSPAIALIPYCIQIKILILLSCWIKKNQKNP